MTGNEHEALKRTCPGCGNDGSEGHIWAVLNGRYGTIWQARCQCSACLEEWDEYFDGKTGTVTNVLLADTPEWLRKERQRVLRR